MEGVALSVPLPLPPSLPVPGSVCWCVNTCVFMATTETVEAAAAVAEAEIKFSPKAFRFSRRQNMREF